MLGTLTPINQSILTVEKCCQIFLALVFSVLIGSTLLTLLIGFLCYFFFSHCKLLCWGLQEAYLTAYQWFNQQHMTCFKVTPLWLENIEATFGQRYCQFGERVVKQCSFFFFKFSLLGFAFLIDNYILLHVTFSKFSKYIFR